MAVAVHPSIADHIDSTRCGAFWMATSIAFKERVCIYNIHLPTSWAPDEIWHAQLQEIHEDMFQQNFNNNRSRIYIGGDWNVDAELVHSASGGGAPRASAAVLGRVGLGNHRADEVGDPGAEHNFGLDASDGQGYT